MSGATAARPDSDSRVTRILGPAVVSLAVFCSLGAVTLWGPVRRLSDSPEVSSRSRYDAMRTVEHFAHRLRDEVDVDVLIREISEVVDRSLHPAQVWLWFAEEAR